MDLEFLKLLAQFGLDGILLFLLSQLWSEYREQNRFIREELTDAKIEREVILSRIGGTEQAERLKAQRALERYDEHANIN